MSEFRAKTTETTDFIHALCNFIDESTARQNYFKSCFALSGDFAEAFKIDHLELYAKELFAGVQTLNACLMENGGVSVDFIDDRAGERIVGKVIGCAGFNAETNSWGMIVTNEKYPSLPGMPYLEVHFDPLELRNSVLNAQLPPS